ncbi:gene transfer agent family protein [Methylobacterium currus]|uniref:gene transfer agent family protein n=1 Tax=Methylobacterium currus TaxID=2051553 RepID=UPI001E49D985|nr:gene transfer agent family protein [Methylobacterium currus]UHC14423.1 gene transfer agent family protein [Methylobacterium currus]
MAPDTSRTAIDAVFGGRRRKLQLTLGCIGELERICGAGIGEIQLRLAGHRFYAADLRETVRLGLIGGGEDLAGAEALMRFNFDQQPLATHLQLAADLLSAAVAGVEPEGNGVTERSDAPATSPSGTAPAA